MINKIFSVVYYIFIDFDFEFNLDFLSYEEIINFKKKNLKILYIFKVLNIKI